MKSPILKIFGRGKEGELMNETQDYPNYVKFKEEHPYPNLTEKQREVLFEAVNAFEMEFVCKTFLGDSISQSIDYFREGEAIVRVFLKLELINENEAHEIRDLSPMWQLIFKGQKEREEEWLKLQQR